MRKRIPLLVAAAAILCFSLLLAVPPCFGQTGDIQDILDGLEGLPFDQFIDASYKQVLLRSPELVTSMGLSQTLGIRDDQLDTICNDFIIETYELEAGILEILETYDRCDSELRAADQLRLLLLDPRRLGRRARVDVSLLPGHPRVQPAKRALSVLRGRAPSGALPERPGLRESTPAG